MTSIAKERILIIEDDVWFYKALYDILSADFQVKVAQCPEDVFDIIENWWPDVILADVLFGRKNLFVLLQEFQSYSDTRNIPIVILSSISQQISKKYVVNFSIKKIFAKENFNPEELILELKNWAKKSREFSQKSEVKK